MLRLSVFVLCCLILLPSTLSAQEEKKPHPQESLKTAIPHAIKLLEDKNYKDLLEGYIPPEELKKMKDAGAFELVVNRFGEGEKAKRLLQALKEAQSLTPEYNEEKTLATFESDKEDSPLKTKPLSFTKIEKLWYIK